MTMCVRRYVHCWSRWSKKVDKIANKLRSEVRYNNTGLKTLASVCKLINIKQSKVDFSQNKT